MIIGVIGGNGFLGKQIVKELKEHHVTIINRDDPVMLTEYDVLINANGNSNKRWANENPIDDYTKTVLSTIHYLCKYTYKKYIHISSVDAIKPVDYYGKNKKIAEQYIMRRCKDYTILRCGALIGKGMYKGVIHDIKSGKIFVSDKSKIQCITTNEVAKIVKQCIDDVVSGIHTLTSIGNIEVKSVLKYFMKKVEICGDKKEVYNYLPSCNFVFKTAYEYIKEVM